MQELVFNIIYTIFPGFQLVYNAFSLVINHMIYTECKTGPIGYSLTKYCIYRLGWNERILIKAIGEENRVGAFDMAGFPLEVANLSEANIASDLHAHVTL